MAFSVSLSGFSERASSFSLIPQRSKDRTDILSLKVKSNCEDFHNIRETLTVSENEELNTKTINEVLSENSRIIEKQLLGFQSGIFKNDAEITNLPGINNIQSTFDYAIDYINNELYRQ